METKQVIVVRKDLKMGWGKMAAQVAHASEAAAHTNYLIDTGIKNVEDFMVWGYAPPQEVKEWLRSSFTKICVWVEDEEHLLKIYNKAKESKISCSLIKDNGKTVFKGVPTYTTVGVGPAEVSRVDEITGELRLI